MYRIQSLLLSALNEVGIAEYSLEHTLRGAKDRLGAYLTHFVLGFLASLSGEACWVKSN